MTHSVLRVRGGWLPGAVLGMSLLVAGGRLAAGEPSPLDAEKGKFQFGPNGATDYTDADIDAIAACPHKPWPGPAKKVDWGEWLTIMLWESNYHIGAWQPLMSPEQIRLFERAGFDVTTVHANSEDIWQSNCRLEVVGPEAPSAGIELGAEWVKRTGRGLMPSALWMTDQGGCDGSVYRGINQDQRVPAGHSSICYSSPNTFRWTVRKIKALREAFKGTATGPDGRFYSWWLKETSRYLYLGANGATFKFSCYCPSCEAEFRRYVERKYGTLAAVNQAYRKHYHAWNEIELPLTESRWFEPQLYYDFILFRQWIREENGDKLWKRLGLTNVDNDGTFQFSTWYFGPFTGINCYRASLVNDYVNLDFGESFGPRGAVAAMTDSVLRDHPEKKALALWGGGPSLYLLRPGSFMRQIGSHFGHVTNMRAIEINGWDSNAGAPAGFYYYFPKFVPWVAKEIAWWSSFGELQADLLRGMKTAQPQIASCFAWPSILFEEISLDHPDGMHPERSKAWTWHPMMFWHSHLPIHILDPEQVEQGDLSKYKVLYNLYGPRNTPESLRKIKEFHAAGGYVYGAFDALTWTLTDEDWSTVEQVFKCAKVTNAWPGRYGPVEKTLKKRVYRWDSKFTEPLGHYEITAAHPALPPVGTKLPVTSAIRTVRPLPGATVYATYNGEPCIVGAERALFVGTDIMSDIAHTAPREYKALSEPWQLNYPSLPRGQFADVLKVLTGFAEYAGVKPPFEVLQDGQRAWNIETGTLVREDGAMLCTLGNAEDRGGAYEVLVPASAGVEVADLVSGRRLVCQDGKVSLELPGFGFAMLLVAKPEVMARALEAQQEVDARVAKVWDLELSRHFFVQATADKAAGFDGLGYPRGWAWTNFMQLDPYPQAILVVPDAAAAADRELAERIRDLFRDFPVPAGKDVTRLNVSLPIKKAGEVTEQDMRERNLLLIGGPAENPLVDRMLPTPELRQKASQELFTTFRPNPDECGGNVVVIGGTPGTRAAAFDKLRRWAFTWFDGYNAPIAPDLLAEIAERSFQENGWQVVSRSDALIVAEKAGQRKTCVIYCQGMSDASRATQEYQAQLEQTPTVVLCDGDRSQNHFKSLLTDAAVAKQVQFVRGDTVGNATHAGSTK